jgi:hypothetical protein
MKEIISPKEKANDLVNTYRMILMDADTECGNEILCTSIAIKTALVAINQMILLVDAYLPLDEHVIELFDYLQQVKKELRKL